MSIGEHKTLTTGLRIRDVVQVKPDMVSDGHLILRTQKNGKPVKLPLHSEIDLPVSGDKSQSAF